MRRKYSLQYSSIYRLILATRKIGGIFLLLFLLSGSSLQAQSEPEDSTAVMEEMVEDDEPAQDDSDDYFLPKWMEGSGMDPMVFRQLPDSAIEALKKDKSFWYADSLFRALEQQRGQQLRVQPRAKDSTVARPRQRERYEPVAERSWFQTLLWIVIIGGFAAFMTIYLINSNVRLFNKKKQQLGAGEEEEPEMDDIFAINYQKEIDKAANSRNYRLAIRLMFLRLLKNLTERNIIQYKHDRTNLDYLMQLSATRYYQDFFRITRNYEYSWYGKFDVSDEAYRIIKNDFDQFDPIIK